VYPDGGVVGMTLEENWKEIMRELKIIWINISNDIPFAMVMLLAVLWILPVVFIFLWCVMQV
jgi:hypothetical protein